MKLLTAALLEGYSPRKDKTVTIRFSTQEKTPGQVAEIHEMLDTFGYLYFKPEEQLTKSEIAEIDDLDTDLYDNAKTQSQRLRNVLYKNWEQDDKGHEKFKEYYKFQTEIIISHFKDKLI